MTAHLTFPALWDSLRQNLGPVAPSFLQARALSNSKRSVFVLPREVEKKFFQAKWFMLLGFFSGSLTCCCYTLKRLTPVISSEYFCPAPGSHHMPASAEESQGHPKSTTAATSAFVTGSLNANCTASYVLFFLENLLLLGFFSQAA